MRRDRTTLCPFAAICAAAAALVLALGCSRAQAPAQPAQGDQCAGCHASPAAPLPFFDMRGVSDPTDARVGAHAQHLGQSPVRAALACTDCHRVPAKPSDPGHFDPGDAAVQFGALAAAGGLSPRWDSKALTCSSTWCHGGGLARGPASAPVWNRPADAASRCTSCHGTPPPLPHPPNGDCHSCHPGTVKSDGTIDLERGQHIDGVVQSPGTACTACHGEPGRARAPAAPPTGAHGETATTAIGVGAHQAHLQGGALRGPIACDECHRVPTDLAHIDGAAQLFFGPLSRIDGVAPAWDRAAATCTTYCHGASLTGGTNPAPRWTRVDGTQAACGACHGNPPPPPHPPARACSACHPGTLLDDGTIDLERGQHIDGVVQLIELSCTSCHGDASRTTAQAAPPRGTRGETSAADRAVGAHQAHLQPGPLSRGVACDECHVQPSSVRHATGEVELSWGFVATRSFAQPRWDGARCSSTFCHGNFWGGNAGNAPEWTRVGQGQAACGSCHGIPPSNHAQSLKQCGLCHPDGYSETTVNPATHVDGNVQVRSLTCTSCHGDLSALDPAPPRSTKGETATTARGVGAHQAHLKAGRLSQPVQCTACHAVPASTGHANGTVDLTWGGLAIAGGAQPQWDGARCSSNYCHGATLPGGSNTTPAWTQVDGTQAACGTCHGTPPPPPHPANPNCHGCHGDTVRDDGSIDVAGGKHLNGVLDVANLTCTSCHGEAQRSPAAIAPAPPTGTRGETATTQRAVGAHQAHLNASALRGPIACSECHAVPTSLGHATGTVELRWGALATAQGAAPSFDGARCSSTYCHGATLGGGTNTTPLWTAVDGTQASCGTCHGLPPPAPHPAVSSDLRGCSECHPQSIDASGALLPASAGGKHLDGHVDITGHGADWMDQGSSGFHAFSANRGLSACTLCHGSDLGGGGAGVACAQCHDANLPAGVQSWKQNCVMCHGGADNQSGAPPRPTWGGANALAAGAHSSHIAGGVTRGLDCVACHAKPADALSNGHLDGAVTVSGYTGADPALLAAVKDPGWSRSTASCSTSYCHGATMPGGTHTAPVWTLTDGTQATCDSCHGLPPDDGPTVSAMSAHRFHTRSVHLQCATCHRGFTSTSVDRSVHVNGVRDVILPDGTALQGWDCSTCHNYYPSE